MRWELTAITMNYCFPTWQRFVAHQPGGDYTEMVAEIAETSRTNGIKPIAQFPARTSALGPDCVKTKFAPIPRKIDSRRTRLS